MASRSRAKQQGRPRKRRPWVDPKRVVRLYKALTWPVVTFFVLSDRKIDRASGMTWRRKLALGWRLFRITRSVEKIGTSYWAHLAMAAKILSFPPRRRGVVVECGSWRGGSTACLSVICDYADRELIVYDSFQGMPRLEPHEAVGKRIMPGVFRGTLEQVRETVRRHGVLERCTFRAGWYEETLPGHAEPIVAAFMDVDLQKSMHECVLHLWPHLVEDGYLFTDECMNLDHCALFWSERWWRKHFDRGPPGLIGSGTGVAVGQFWLGPHEGGMGGVASRPYQFCGSVAYTRKDFAPRWGFDPDDPLPAGSETEGRTSP